MLVKMTRKEVKNSNAIVYRISTADTGHLLKFARRVGYNCGVYGWNCDIYDMYPINGMNIAITVGDRPFGKEIPHSLVENADLSAKEVLDSDLTDKEKEEAVNDIFGRLIRDYFIDNDDEFGIYRDIT